MTLDASQRSRLAAAKLSALVRDLGDEPGPVQDVATSSATLGDSGAYVLIDDPAPGALAGAVLWALRQHAEALCVFVDDDAGSVARWASYFELAGGAVVAVRRVEAASSVEVEAEPLPAVPDAVDASAGAIAPLIDAGVEVVDEHGSIRGEVLGLEVARLVESPTERGGDGELHLEAGVGRFDRDAAAAAHPDESPADALGRTVGMVREHRFTGAGPHPLQMLVRSRWLRSAAIASPSDVGADELTAVGMTTEPGGLKDQHPAAALGRRGETPIVAVFSSGVDLALVPLAADTRAWLDPGAELVLALPERDRHGATIDLVSALRDPAEFVSVPEPWG